MAAATGVVIQMTMDTARATKKLRVIAAALAKLADDLDAEDV